jgi:hypothetical protein
MPMYAFSHKVIVCHLKVHFLQLVAVTNTLELNSKLVSSQLNSNAVDIYI